MGGSGRGVAVSGQWVISSDVVYEPEGYAPLLATLCSLASRGLADDGARPRVLMAHRSRNPDEHRFFTAAAARFAIWVLDGPPMRPLGSADGASAIPVRGGSPAGGAGDGARPHADDPATVRVLEFEFLG